MTRRGGRTPGDAIDILIDALAVYRATRLLTEDTLTAPFRDAWVRGAYAAAGGESNAKIQMRGMRLDPDRDGSWEQYAQVDKQPPKLATLITCRWCAGMWVAAGAVLVRRFFPRVWEPLSRVGALSAVAALTAGLDK